jgi:F-type H+-transporting ATPase subunit b
MADIVLAQAESDEEHGIPVTEGGEVLGTEEHGEESHAAEEHAAGMPQLNIETFPNQIFWLVLTLVAIYMILNRVALPRIGAVLAERQGTITNDIAAAEDLRNKAKEAEAAYDKALADARSEAQRIAQQARDDIQADLDAAVAKADEEIAERTAESEKEIGAIRDEATENVRIVARETAAEIVRALGMEPEQGALDSVVDQRIGARA